MVKANGRKLRATTRTNSTNMMDFTFKIGSTGMVNLPGSQVINTAATTTMMKDRAMER